MTLPFSIPRFSALFLGLLFAFQGLFLAMPGNAYAEVAEAAVKPPTGKTTEALRIERLNRPKVFSDLSYGETSQTLDLCMPAETNTAQAFQVVAKDNKTAAPTTGGKQAAAKPPSKIPVKSAMVPAPVSLQSRKNIKRTAVIFVHGGNFKSGSKEQLLPYCRLFAQAGFLSVSVNYRLAPTHPFPAAQDDVEDAIAWLQSKASHYGFDPKRIVVVGYSAGGNLALMASSKINLAYKPVKPTASQKPPSKIPAKTPAKPPVKTAAVDNRPVYPVAGVIAMAAPTNFETLLSNVPQLKSDIQRYLDGANPKSASPLYSATSKSSPVFLIHGQHDLLVPVAQSREYQELLQELKVPVKMQTYAGVDHNFFKPNPQLNQMLRDMTAFLLYVENRNFNHK